MTVDVSTVEDTIPSIIGTAIWFTALIGGGMVVVVSIVATLISMRPVFKLQPASTFAGR